MGKMTAKFEKEQITETENSLTDLVRISESNKSLTGAHLRMSVTHQNP